LFTAASERTEDPIHMTTRDANYWRDRAEQAREHAEQMHDRVSKHEMLNIARSYDALARRSEELTAGRSRHLK
jgi:hypothetical protein